jgi:hypothetical protein
MHWLFAYGLTQFIEAPLYFFLLYRAYRAVPDAPSVPTARLAVSALLPSALTHPILWWVAFPALYATFGYWGTAAVCEVTLTAIEGLVLVAFLPTTMTRRWLYGLGGSVLGNASSFTTGLITSRLFDWP